MLGLPWGFEILLAADALEPAGHPPAAAAAGLGRKVLIVGLGPAGFTLAHHLMNDGHTVVAIDGLKIEPLGFDPRAPVRDVETLYENLDDRVMAGFGGVAEYGITVRWNKNYLKLIRILLERRAEFAAFGGVRFGGGATLSVDDAWAMGFDHVALCMGAGRPTIIDMPNGLARGVRQASDFLMALQLTGAAKTSSIANLQLRLPVVVIGGGLTAIDTGDRKPRLLRAPGGEIRAALSHAGRRARRGGGARRPGARRRRRSPPSSSPMPRRSAPSASPPPPTGALPPLAGLLDSWGGATVAYRRKLTDSPSYTLNHEEVAKAMEEGVRFAEGLAPVAVEVDRFGHAAGLRCTPRRRHRGGAARARRAGGRRHPAQHRAGARAERDEGRPHPARRQILPGGGHRGQSGDAGALAGQAG